ncbi:MAG: Gldg family protein [Phycisphaeraceae bacterium]|nr:Gldg family protein [Phycisphaeraceae bacterium]
MNLGRNATLVGTLIATLVVFIAVNMIAGFGLRGVRLDATRGGMYTLTQGSRNIAQSPAEPVKLTFYYTSRLAQGRPVVQTYAQRVRELLEEYARVSGGKIILTVIDPAPFSEAEDQAVAAGIVGVPLNQQGENLYFGLVGVNSADGREVIPFFDPQKERFLEYDLSRLIYSLANPKKKIVGLIAGLQIEGGFTIDPMTRQPRQTPPWYISTEIGGTFEIKNLGRDISSVDPDVSVLMVLHPKDLPDTTLYAIDQFILGGGRALLFVDPYCENDRDPQQQPGMPPSAGASNLDRLLHAWGVEVPPSRIAADLDNAISVSVGPRNRPETVQHVAYMSLKSDNLSKEDPITGQLGVLNFATSGFIRGRALEGGPAAAITPLATTGDRAMEMSTDLMMLMNDPKTLLRSFIPGSAPLTVAARLSGAVRSAFPDGAPGPGDGLPPTAAHKAQSEGPINVILVADADFAADFMWVRVRDFLGTPFAQKVANNGDFIMTALDNLSGSTDLISVRARQEAARPFKRVEEMRRRAEQNLLAKSQELEREVEETRARINELQARKSAEEALIFTPEQEAEWQNMLKVFSDKRKELREVRAGLNADIERLGTLLKFINIGLIPILVSLGALALGWYRVSRRRAATRD